VKPSIPEISVPAWNCRSAPMSLGKHFLRIVGEGEETENPGDQIEKTGPSSCGAIGRARINDTDILVMTIRPPAA
jgi:hypothetical protein